MSPSLPSIIILRTTKLSCVLHCTQLDTYRNILLCNKDDIASPHAKFQLERVDSDESLYNIRCCYNNKLWSNNYEGLIQATEKNAGEAALFRIEPVDSDHNKTIRLMCMKLQRYVCFTGADWVLKAESETPRKDSHDVFTVIDWDSLVMLPKHVAFKANNGCYIYPKCFPLSNGKYGLYASITDIGDRRVANEIITRFDQTIDIKNNHVNIFWKMRPSWQYRFDPKPDDIGESIGPILFFGLDIFAQLLSGPTKVEDIISRYDHATGSNSHFLPVRIGNARNVIALRNVYMGTLCIREDDKFVCSDDSDATIREEAKLQVEELVVSRKVYDVDFRFDDSLVYNENVAVRAFDETTNWLPNTTTKKQLRLESRETISSTYDTSSSVRSSMAFSFEATIPLIKDGLSFTPKAEISTEEEKKHAWGKATDTNFTMSAVVRANVPPKSQVTAEMEATEARCEIPFSYTQRDLTTRGEQVVETKDDGAYTCTNCYNFNIRISQKKLADSNERPPIYNDSNERYVPPIHNDSYYSTTELYDPWFERI